MFMQHMLAVLSTQHGSWNKIPKCYGDGERCPSSGTQQFGSSEFGTSGGNRAFWRAEEQPRRERSSSSEGERAGGNEENAGGRTSTDDLVGGLEPYHYPKIIQILTKY